jgi:hypothetical protein
VLDVPCIMLRYNTEGPLTCVELCHFQAVLRRRCGRKEPFEAQKGILGRSRALPKPHTRRPGGATKTGSGITAIGIRLPSSAGPVAAYHCADKRSARADST